MNNPVNIYMVRHKRNTTSNSMWSSSRSARQACLNKEKCEFSKSSIKFLIQVVDENGVRPDPDKVRAIQAMKPPTNLTEFCQILGIVNQLTKFSPHLADRMKPLRDHLIACLCGGLGGIDQDRVVTATNKLLAHVRF